jgi:hypothetical protein
MTVTKKPNHFSLTTPHVPRRFWLFVLVTALLTPRVWLTCFCRQSRRPTCKCLNNPRQPPAHPTSRRTTPLSPNHHVDFLLHKWRALSPTFSSAGGNFASFHPVCMRAWGLPNPPSSTRCQCTQ